MVYTNKSADGKLTNTDTVALFPKWNTNIELLLSLYYARGNESIIYVTNLGKPTESYIYARKKLPLASYPAAKHPNAAILGLQTFDQRPMNFFINTTRASTFALAIIFQT